MEGIDVYSKLSLPHLHLTLSAQTMFKLPDSATYQRETFKIERGVKHSLAVKKKIAPVAPSPSPTRKTPVVDYPPAHAPAPPPRRRP